jgi:hypothetical protein
MERLISRYPLTGVREATTAPRHQFIAHATEVLAADERIVAVYLVGGFAVGLGDPWSDVDLQCVVAEAAFDEVVTQGLDLVERITPVVYAQPFGQLVPGGGAVGPIGGNCITPEWLHFDIVLVSGAALDATTMQGIVPLFDRAGILPADPVPRPEPERNVYFPADAVRHFLYMLGNMVSIIGRNEPIPGTNGVILVRDLDLVRLFLAEQGLTSVHGLPGLFPFTKRLRRFLSDEQNALLEALPPVVATLDSVIEGYVALAEIFLPRAKALADRTGAEWPHDYERATVAYFERSLGVTINA